MRSPRGLTATPVFLAVAAVFAAAVLWGTTGTIQALLPSDRDPLAVAALRPIIGALGLVVFCYISGKRLSDVTALPHTEILLAGVSIAVYNVSFFSGVSMAGVGIGTAIALGSGPLWVSLHDAVTQKPAQNRPSRVQVTGQMICVVGVVVLAWSGERTRAAGTGCALAALAGLSYAAYSIFTNRLGGRAPAAVTAAATFCCAGCLLAPLLLVADRGWLGISALPPLLFLGLAATGVAFFLFTYGVSHMPASTAVTLALAEPLTAWLLATFVLREPTTPSKIAGAAMVLGGLALAARSLARDRIRAEPPHDHRQELLP